MVPGSTKEDILKLIDHYRIRFSDIGIFENQLYPGIPDLIKNKPIRQKNFVATSKPHVFANKIIFHFGLSQYFAAIHGSELNGERSDKGDLIKFILETERLDSLATIMVGDRKHDILGAKKSGLRSTGIAWGYGSLEELKDAGADRIFMNPYDLGVFLTGEGV